MNLLRNWSLREGDMGSVIGTEKIAAQKAGVTVDEWRRRRAENELWCYCCRSWQPLSSFGTDKSRSSGKASACKICVSHKGTASRYGISIADARELRSGDAACDICNRQHKLEVDHNHITGKVRGVLCSRCNGALGQFCDDIEMLKKGIIYLTPSNKSVIF